MGVVARVLCVVLFVLGVVHCAVLTDEKCKLEDSACMKKQFQKAVPIFMAGIPELGVEVLDALDMDDVKFDLAGLQFTLSDGKLKGLKSSVIDDVTWNVKKNQFIVEFHMDGSVKGHYTAAGRVLILPITGDGVMTLKLKNVRIKFYIDYETVKGADSKEHFKTTDVKFDFEVKDNAHFHFTNLFKGNKDLSDAMLKFLNENWSQITAEFGRPLLQASANKLFRNVQTYFDKVAVADIAVV